MTPMQTARAQMLHVALAMIAVGEWLEKNGRHFSDRTSLLIAMVTIRGMSWLRWALEIVQRHTSDWRKPFYA